MSNEYYTPSGVPANNAALSSSAIRGEEGLIEDGFDKMPTLAGNGSKIVRVNSGGTALEVVATVPHEQGGIEANISAIANGGILVGTATGTMAIRASALTDGAAGFLKHELGGIEADISAIANGGILVGTGAGTMAIRASAFSDGASGYLNLAAGGLGFNANGIVDGEFIVGTGPGTAGLESGQTALSSLGMVSKYKTSNTSRSLTTTLADDPHLAGWSLDADNVYKIEGLLIISGGSTGDFKFTIQADQTPQIGYFLFDGNGQLSIDMNADAAISIAVDGVVYGYRIFGTIHSHATNATTLDLQWAQNTSNATLTTVYKGSWITVEKLGTA